MAIAATLAALAVAGWVVLLTAATGRADAGGAMGGMGAVDGSGLAAAGPDLTMGSAALFFTMWVAMMVAMMFPAAAPMVLLYAKVQHTKRGGSTPVFVMAYLALWVAFGAVAFALAAGVEALVERSAWAGDHWGRAAGGLMVAAGAYQLSPLKQRCLAACRSPLSFLVARWRDGRRGAWRMGLDHGVYCLGCCWLLFLVLVPLGVMNVALMLVVTLVVFAEKALPLAVVTTRLTAAALAAFGVAAMVRPSLLPTVV